jgi:hypothetical protein
MCNFKYQYAKTDFTSNVGFDGFDVDICIFRFPGKAKIVSTLLKSS